ncbi:MAG: hypothetical protein KDA69_06535 [Planctomycetaceae bacterium]|nr:hypothetical protein [Planctomycetaceae bacterium]
MSRFVLSVAAIVLIAFPLNASAQFGSGSMLGGGGLGGDGSPPVTSVGGRAASPPSEKLKVALESNISLDFVDTTFEDCMAYLGETLSISISIDETGLEETGFARDTPITLAIENVPVEQAIHMLLERNELGMVCHGDVLEITSAEEAEESFFIQMYDISPLVGAGTAGPIDPEDLTDLLIEGIPESLWIQYDGNGGNLRVVGEVLVVTHNFETQKAVGEFLEQLQKLRKSQQRSFDPEALTLTAYKVSQPIDPNFGPVPEGAAKKDLPTELVSIISTSISPGIWSEEKVQGEPAIWAVPGAVVVRADGAVHAEIRKFLKPFQQELLPMYHGFGGGFGGLGTVPAGGGGLNVQPGGQGFF